MKSTSAGRRLIVRHVVWPAAETVAVVLMPWGVILGLGWWLAR